MKRVNAILTFLLAIQFSWFLAAKDIVVVHVGAFEFRRMKADLIQESTYFADLFSNIFGAFTIDQSGDYHVNLVERSVDSMKAVFEFLIYGDVDMTDKKLLSHLRKDAQFLGIHSLLATLEDLQEEGSAKKPAKSKWVTKAKIFVAKGDSQAKSARTNKLQQNINDFFSSDDKRILQISAPFVLGKDAYESPIWVSIKYEEKVTKD